MYVHVMPVDLRFQPQRVAFEGQIVLFGSVCGKDKPSLNHHVNFFN